MAVYDDQKQRDDTDQFENIVGQIDPEERAQMERAAVAGAASDLAAREGQADSNDSEDGQKASGKKALSPDEVNKDESSAAPNKDSDKNDQGAEAEGIQARVKQRISKLLKNKLFIGVAFGGGFSLGALILIIIFLLGLFKIPNLAEHIIGYQFARTTRDYAQRAENVNDTTIGIESADDDTWTKMKNKYYDSRLGQAQTKVTDTWSKLDKYRPQKVINNMQRDKTLTYDYQTTKYLKRQQLKSITVNGEAVDVENLSLKNRLIPGAQFRANSRLAAQVRPAISTAMADDDIGPIVRGLAMRKIRQELGVSLIAWHIDKIKGKDQTETRQVIEQENYKQVEGNDSPVNPKGTDDKINDVAEKAKEAQDADVADTATLEKVIESGGNSPTPGVLKILQSSFVNSGLKGILDKVLGFVNPVYGIAAPVCMVYEGSLTNSGSTINNADAKSQRTFVEVAAASSQIKDGYDTTGYAAGAFAAKTGQIEQSNPEIRANGLPVDTSKSISNQSSPSGQFSIYDALLPGPFASVFNNVSKVCPILTNIWTGIGLGAVSIAAAILSAGGTGAAEGATDVAATIAVKSVTERIIDRLITSGSFAKEFGTKLVITGGAIAGATFLAKFYVLSQMGSAQTSPLATGVPYVNTADAGGNSQNSTTERTMMRGAPLTTPEIQNNNLQDAQFRSAMVSQQSTFERYLAVDNADSLVNHIGSSIEGSINGSIFSTLANMVGSALSPAHTLATVTRALSPGRVLAASTDTYNYGNVQFGFTAEENELMTTDLTYKSNLENQLILDQSGKEDEIAKKFGPCYDLTMGMGDLLTKETGEDGDNKYYIVRDDKGNVDGNKGLCSQKNVGPHSPDYGDLVFRWRLAGGYDNTMEQEDEEQNPTLADAPLDGAPAPTDPTDPTAPSGPIVIGDTSSLTCDVGTDSGIGDGYANGTLYKTRLCTVQGTLVSAQIAVNVNKLLDAAKLAGIHLTGGSGFRTMAEQEYLYNCYLTKSCNNGNLAAKPGYSNHQMGLAIDFKCNGSTITSGDDCFNWLRINAATYGLKNLPAEAWHWSYDGS